DTPACRVSRWPRRVPALQWFWQTGAACRTPLLRSDRPPASRATTGPPTCPQYNPKYNEDQRMFRRILFLGACLSIAAAGQPAAQLKQQAEVLKARGGAAGARALIGGRAAANPKSAELEDETGFLLAVLNRNPEAKPHFERAIELE